MKTLLSALFTILLLLAAGCGGNDASDDAEWAAEEAERAAEEAEQAADEAARAAEEATADLGEEIEGIVGEALSATREALTGGRDVEPVDHQTLQDLLPETLDGMPREDVEGEREGAMGFFVTSAKGTYRGDDGSVEIAIVDIGGVASPAHLGFAWAEEDVKRESADGYERTVRFRGYRAHERYDRSAERGQMSVLVEDRFVVAVEGDEVPMTTLKDALSRIDLDRLAAMRDVGVKNKAE